MVFPIAGGNESKGYEVSNSLRFNDDDSARLSRTPSSEGNKKTWSYSTWFKRGNLKSSGTMNFISAGASSGTNGTCIQTNDDSLRFIQDAGTPFFTFQSSQVLRDVAAWYHLLVTCDTTDGTAGDRIKFYLNGNNITSDMSYTNGSAPSQNSDLFINDDAGHNIGARSHHNDNFFDGYMAETHLIDGTVKAPTDFGEFDDNGVWVPKKYTGSYGTNGFFLEFQQTGTSANSSGIGADTSGNDHHWAVSNLAATDVTTDTCTNNFCTLNPLFNTSSLILKEGNLHTESSSGAGGSTSTYNISNGKWYFETCYIFGTASYAEMGIINGDASFSDIGHTTNTGSVLYRADGKIYKNTGSGFSVDQTVTASSTGDIIGIAINLNDQEISFYLNNSQVGSTVDISYMSNDIIIRLGFGYHVAKLVANFGQEGSFAGNKTAQGNSDGKYGNFYYTPPSGYYALCTKRLAEFG